MNKKEFNVLVHTFAKEYKKAGRKKKTNILTQLETITGYHRKYLTGVLICPSRQKKQIKRNRISEYSLILKPLRILWAVSNYACGKRLKPLLSSLIAALRRHKELIVTPFERKLLLQISSATIDRLLVHDRKRINIKGRSGTKPGSLLKHQIPIKMWTDWDNTVPGL